MSKECYVNMDRWITLKSPVVSRDSFGDEILTWTSVDIPAAVEYKSGTESMTASSKEQGVTTAIFTIRYRSGLTEKQQITFETNEYDIIGIAEVSRRAYSKIIAILKR